MTRDKYHVTGSELCESPRVIGQILAILSRDQQRQNIAVASSEQRTEKNMDHFVLTAISQQKML
jgi:hypothetical protein